MTIEEFTKIYSYQKDIDVFANNLAISFILLVSCGGNRWDEIRTDNGYNLVIQKKGQTLGYTSVSGVTIITKDGYAFKDMNRNGSLEPYEDWRLPAEERASDLASRLSVEEIAGLMLYSSHQSVPAESWSGLYDVVGSRWIGVKL